MDRKRIEAFLAIPKKANYVLQILSLLLFCIVLRLVYLSVYEHDSKERQKQARTQKVVVEAPLRGTIQDRFGTTLARNQVLYQACIVWSDIVEHVPRSTTYVDSSGKVDRILVRKKYISALSSMLARQLNLEARRIEDVIYSYAVFSHSLPIPIKSGLSEREFYRLNAQARLWPGLLLKRTSTRIYPQGTSGCHVVGYTDSLSKEEYDAVISEIHTLRTYLKAKEVEEEVELPLGITSYFHAKERLQQLERCGYGMLDSVGKAGIEASFDEQLRGVRGRKKYITNAKGDVIASSSASSRALSGKRIKLTISSELQDYCEKVLLMSEKERQEWWKEKNDHKGSDRTAPLFRGGAIVVLDPKSHEILALASTPRFDPNEITKRRNKTLLLQHQKEQPISWHRGESLVEALWDGFLPMTQEKVKKNFDCYEEALYLDWDHFLTFLCSNRPYILNYVRADRPIGPFIQMQRDLFIESKSRNLEPKQFLEKLIQNDLPTTSLGSSSIENFKKKIETKNVQEAALLFDIGRLLLRQENISEALVQEIGSYSFSTMYRFSKAKAYMMRLFEEAAFKEFQKGPFQTWRDTHEKSFLLEKRKEEEQQKKCGQPYLLYIDRECQRQFEIWWKDVSALLLKTAAGVIQESALTRPLKHTLERALIKFFEQTPPSIQKDCFIFLSAIKKVSTKHVEGEFLSAIQCYKNLEFPLLSTYRMGGSSTLIRTCKELVSCLFMLSPPPTLSFAFSQVSPPGSIFKLVTAYAALEEQAMKTKEAEVSPDFFVFKDEVFRQNNKVYVGYDNTQKPIPQVYRGGRIPKSLNYHIGTVNMIGAIANSSNPYFALLADEKLHSPEDLVSAAKVLGYGEKSGLCLPGEATGRVPNDLASEKTNLYTTAIGQHTLLATPLQSSLMLAALSTDGTLYTPKLVQMALGRDMSQMRAFREGDACQQRELLQMLGIDFALFLDQVSFKSPYRVYIPKSKCRRKVRLDGKVKDILLSGMEAAVSRLKKSSDAMRGDFSNMSFALKSFINSRGMVGKSSTAESLETIGLSLNEPPYMYSHTAFGAVFFDDEASLLERKMPSLVVVVFLRYGKFGKHAAPLAAAVRDEWLKIKQHHAKREL